MRFKTNTSRFDYPEIESHTAASGERVYYTEAGDAPSVTTILSTLPHPELDAWKERVGAEEAERVSTEATTIGSYMHDMLECYVMGETYEQQTGDELETMALEMFRCVRMFGLSKLGEVWGVEVALHLSDLYAGRTDLIGLFDRKPSIIDYKTSKFNKKAKYLENYKLQIAAYAVAHEHMFPELKFEQGVLLIGMRPAPEFGKKAQIQKVIIDADELDEYRVKWVEVLEQYHA